MAAIADADVDLSEPEPDSAWSAWSRSVDHVSVGACLALFAIGVVLAFAASPTLAARTDAAPFHFGWRHFLFGVPTFVIVLGLSFSSARWVRRIGVGVALTGLIALALLPLYGVDHGKGAVRWFSVLGTSVQPSEFLKPGLMITCAWLLSAMTARDPLVARFGTVSSCLLMAVAAALLILQPDYGQTALIAAVWGAMFFIAGAPPSLLLSLALAVIGVGAAGYLVEPHIAARIEAFLDPTVAAGRQMQVAAEAIANGGWTGLGLGEGIEKARLPDAHTDFIIAVAAEEYGVGLPLLILTLFAVVTLRAFWRLREAEDMFVRLAGAGLALLVGVQAFVNAAVAVQLLPAKGMTLPFISSGGSSMVATGLTLGLLLALTRRRPGDLAAAIRRR